MLAVLDDGHLIGWCQWYRWRTTRPRPPPWALVTARPGSITRLATPAWVGRGVGTRLIGLLAAELRRQHPGAGFLVGLDATNIASRRVLEKNGFELVAVQTVVTEPTDAPMAIYRLSQRA